MNRIDYLDGWRGTAIALVLFAHFVGYTQIDTGRLGVDIFFALSGALMGKILFIQHTPLRTFYMRRISRIIPAFFLYVIAAFSLTAIFQKELNFKEIVSTLLFFRTYFPVKPDIWSSTAPIAHIWSLNVEEHAYIIMSLLSLLALNWRAVFPLLFTALTTQLLYLFYISHPLISPIHPEIRTETAIAYIFYSAAFCLMEESTAAAKFVNGYLGIAAFVAATVCYVKGIPWYYQLFPPILLAYSVNSLKYMPTTIHRTLAFKPLRLLGLWSYSIYLWQQPFHDHKDFLTPTIALFGALATGICSYYFFEQPIRTYLNNFTSAKLANQN